MAFKDITGNSPHKYFQQWHSH